MADETVASLGFEVNSKPLDDAKQKLSEVSTEANKTGKAVDDFNQKVGNTGAAATKAADGVGKVGPALGAVESAARRAGTSVEEMRARTAAFSAETSKLAAGTASAASAIGSIAKEAGAVAPALGAVGAATRAVTREHEAHNKALSGLRGNLRGMSPLLNQFGGGLSDLVQYSRAARLGIEGFALVAGGAAILALEKLGDEIERTKNRFAGLAGSTDAGAKAYDAVKAAAKSSGVEFSALAGAVEKAIIGQEQFADKNVIYADSADRVAKKTAEVSAAFGTFGQIMQANLATAEQENRALKALGDSFEKTGTLGVDAFKKIRDESPSTALAISNAFGFKTVKDFIAELDKAPIKLDEFVKRMALVKPAVDAAFTPDKPKNFEQALAGVTAASKDLLETLAQAGAFDVFKNILVGTKKEVEALNHPLGSLAETFREAGEKSTQAWGSFVTFAKDENSIFGTSMTVDVEGAVLKSLAILGRLPSEGIAAITSWANSAIAEFNRMAQGAVSAATTALNALKQIAAGGGGSPGSTNPMGDNSGIQLGPPSSDGGSSGAWSSDSSGGASGSWSDSGISPQGSDAGAPGFDLGMADLPAFAGGGQFTVAGSGGTDSQVVSFKSTPGEVVTVSTPEQMAQSGAISGITTAQGSQSTTPVGVVSATPEPAALATVKEITDAIDKSTIDISKKVTEGSDNIVSALNKLTGAASAPVVDSSTGLPLSTLASRGSLSGRGAAGAIGGAGFGIGMGAGGFTVKGGASPVSEIEKRHAATRAEDESAAKQSDSKYMMPRPAPIRGSAGSVSGRPIGQFAAATNPDYGPSSYDFGMSSMYATNYDGSGDIYGSLSDYNSGISDFYGTNYDGSGAISGSVSDIGYTDVLGGGFDPGVMDYGGGSVDAGYFATGGSFTVPGSSGVDKTLVSMHATPGETVTVTPLSSNVATANADPSSQANITNKTVNIHVQAGIQAESFIRSRAQIARGF